MGRHSLLANRLTYGIDPLRTLAPIFSFPVVDGRDSFIADGRLRGGGASAYVVGARLP